MSIKLKKTIAKKVIYLKTVLAFFSEIGFDKEDELIKLLNKLRHKYVDKLLHALIFYQYSEKVIKERDDILRPVLLICLIDAVEEGELLSEKIKIFFRRLDNKDKLYLLNHLKILKGRGKNRGFKRTYDDLIKRNKFFKYFRDVNYEKIDPNSKEINTYVDKVAKHFYYIRNEVLHEARQILYAPNINEEYTSNQLSFFTYKIRPKIKKGEKNIKKKRVLSNINFLKFRKIVKKGILKKIAKNKYP